VLIIQVGGWKGERLLGLLCAAGYDARVVDERDAALEILKGEHPILLVVDGAADLNLYRALRAASIVPILVLAPESDQDLVTTALDAGVDDYQAGPISNREIIARVHAIVRSARRKSFGEFVVRA
jgi:DNA-binding response OmpR family regulator